MTERLFECEGCDATARTHTLPYGWIEVRVWHDDEIVSDFFHDNDCIFTFMHAYGLTRSPSDDWGTA